MSALCAAVTRIRTWVSSATTRGTDHYTITAIEPCLEAVLPFHELKPDYVRVRLGGLREDSAGPRSLAID